VRSSMREERCRGRLLWRRRVRGRSRCGNRSRRRALGRRSRRRLASSTTASIACTLTSRRQLHFVAVFLVFDWLGVEVVLVRVGSASVESATSIVVYFARSRDGKALGRGGSDITLQLSSGRCKNAATSVRVGNLSILNAVSGGRIATTNAVLAISELTDGVRFSARSGQLETATISPGKDRSGNAASECCSGDV